MSDFIYSDFLNDEYPDGDAGVKEMVEDTDRLIRYIFRHYPVIRKNLIDNIYVIAGGDTKKQLQLFNSLLVISNPIISEYSQQRVISYKEIINSFPIRYRTMNAILTALDISAERINKILQRQEPVSENEDFAVSIKERSNE